MARGAMWMILVKLGERGLGLLSTLILVRVLLPTDFGIVAMATSFTFLLELLTAFGFDVALIKHQQPTKALFDTAWTFNVIFYVLVAAAMLVGSGPLAHFYGEPRLTAVICALACGSVVQGLENIGVVHFRRDLQFDREFRFQLIKKLAMFCTTVPLALLWRNYWALVAGMVCGRVIGVVTSYAMQSYRPRFSLEAAAELVHFSKWLAINNVLGYAKERCCDFVIGRLLGPSSLGLFNVSNEIATLPSNEMVAPINRAVLPGYAKMSADPLVLQRGYLDVTALIALVSVAAGVGVAAIAPILVPAVLGKNWLAAAPLIEILALYGVVYSMQSEVYSVFLVLGRPDIQVKTNVAYAAVLVGAMVTLVHLLGLQGAAWAFLGTAVLMMPVNIGLALRLLRLPGSSYLALLWRPTFASAAMYVTVRMLVAPVTGAESSGMLVLSLLGAILLGIVSYAVALWILWMLARCPEGAERILLTTMRRWLRPRAAS
ncbi:MAG TPA: lipopolysaccharide biosynthesis protein [Steroidobacteraceae bacterium]|nr:lipopolysaccharide biosynthesis protein [Steroidobacteraceae bacterium]